MNGVISSQEYARGYRKKFLMVFHDVGVLGIQLLVLSSIVKLLDALVFKTIGHQSGVVSVEQLMQHDWILRMLHHRRTHHHDAESRIRSQVDNIRITPATLLRVPDGEFTRRTTVPLRYGQTVTSGGGSFLQTCHLARNDWHRMKELQ